MMAFSREEELSWYFDLADEDCSGTVDKDEVGGVVSLPSPFHRSPCDRTGGVCAVHTYAHVFLATYPCVCGGGSVHCLV